VNAIQTSLPGVFLLEPRVVSDARGFFLESYNQRTFEILAGITQHFVQDNHSRSTRNVLRGLHYQVRQPQGKLVRVLQGSVFDVVVDLRRSSPTFGKWLGTELSADNRRMIWMPAGFAHGFLVTSSHADFFYKATDYWAPQHERTIAWNDTDIGIEWPLVSDPILSAKDQAGVPLRKAELFD
jgi:dTDP-4-dehydrorhamnose 3,5-epimerase